MVEEGRQACTTTASDGLSDDGPLLPLPCRQHTPITLVATKAGSTPVQM